jgi:hypothetical protein
LFFSLDDTDQVDKANVLSRHDHCPKGKLYVSNLRESAFIFWFDSPETALHKRFMTEGSEQQCCDFRLDC